MKAKKSLLFLSAFTALTAEYAAFSALTPEQETLIISQKLVPIPDQQWKEIAGDRATEQYAILKGDTLYDISKRLFGDPKYWPKIWALNNHSITNPHHIRPGKLIAFMSGTGTSLPGVELTSADVPVQPQVITQKPNKRSQQWRDLPKQPWENFMPVVSSQVDPLGFDKRNKITFKTVTDFSLPAFAASETISPLGTVTGALTDNQYISHSDSVFIQSNGGLQIGEIYTLTTEPTSLRVNESSPEGFSYSILGRVKITGNQDALYFGKVISGNDTIPRGAQLIPDVPRIQEMAPIPGPSAIEATIFVDPNLSTYATTQFKHVFLDRGTDDGIQPGMVFRNYQHRDRSTSETITDTNAIPYADIQVVQTSPRFSLGFILSSEGTIEEHWPATLLTDVSDVHRRGGFTHGGANALPAPPSSPEDLPLPEEMPSDAPPEALPEDTAPLPPEAPPTETSDELETLDSGEEINGQEAQELKQLEDWKNNPPVTESPSELPAIEGPPPAAEPMPAEDVPLPPSSPVEALPEAPAPPTAPVPEDQPLPP